MIGKKEPSMEMRVLLAFVLSMAVMALWTAFFVPKRPPQPSPAPRPAVPAASPEGAAAGVAPPVIPQPAPPKAAAEEKTIVVENDLYRVELSNRGGVVRSWQLKRYTDDAKPPRTLDVVHADAAREHGTWPLWITLAEPDLPTEQTVNQALYEVNAPAQLIRGPGEVVFEWSDGRLGVTKRLRFSHSYLVEIETSVMLEGQPRAHAVAWRGGFGDPTVYNAVEQVTVFYRQGGKLEAMPYKKLGVADRPESAFRQEGTMEYAGIQDSYFATAFVPHGPGLALWHWKREREVEREGAKTKLPVAEMAAGSTVAGPVALRLFVGPKDFGVLGSLSPPMTELVNFGDWLGVFAKPLFFFLKWTYGYVPNYGWAIVVLTVIINMVLFPLKLKSWRSMQRMQKVAPEIRAIQERYKKYSLRDPRKQQMNQEVMDVYKREGINPMGSCWPMLLQMPIWIALYRMLNVTIELRHAPWLWIRDLSAKDPWYLLPVAMGVTMYLMQKMTPVTTTDPAQQRMMQVMPIMFGGMFVIFPVSSGLVLYILASNVVGIAQQWFLNRTEPVAVKPAREKDGKKKS